MLGKPYVICRKDFFAAPSPRREPAVAKEAHVALAHESRLGGIRILRRGYNFTDGSDGLGPWMLACS